MVTDLCVDGAARDTAMEHLGSQWRTNQAAATGYARKLVGASDADDIVAEATLRVLTRIAGGAAPIDNFRAYLLTSVRNAASDHLARRREFSEADLDALDRPVTDAEPEEDELIREALATLPPAWQQVLWWAEGHGLPHRDVARWTGTNANAVSALNYRAREALRKAYLVAHLGQPGTLECAWAHDHLPALVRGTLSPVRRTRLVAHLSACDDCTHAHDELAAVGSRMPSLAGTQRRASA